MTKIKVSIIIVILILLAGCTRTTQVKHEVVISLNDKIIEGFQEVSSIKTSIMRPTLTWDITVTDPSSCDEIFVDLLSKIKSEDVYRVLRAYYKDYFTGIDINIHNENSELIKKYTSSYYKPGTTIYDDDSKNEIDDFITWYIQDFIHVGSDIYIYDESDVYMPLDQLPEDYSLEMAKKDLCVVYENSDITEGQAVWDEFIDRTQKGQPSMVRLAFYYALLDPSRYSKEHYEEIKDDYPVLYPMDLTYDGDKYSLKFYDEGKLILREFKYMMKYEGQANIEAIISDYTYYVLVNDNSVTWDEIQKGMYSSQMGDAIEHYKVYSDIVYK